MAECVTCDIVNLVYDIKNSISVEVSKEVSKQILFFLRAIFGAYLLVMAIKTIIGHILIRDAFVDIIIKTVLLVVVNYFLLPSVEGQSIFEWIFYPIETTALKYGLVVLKVVSFSGELPQQATLYSTLVAFVEREIGSVIYGLGQVIDSVYTQGGLSISWIISGIAFLALSIPFIFVIGIFIAFIIEAMFKISIIGILSPLLLAASVFGKTRAFATSSLRLLLGSALTVVIICGAMGFTVAMTRGHADVMIYKIQRKPGMVLNLSKEESKLLYAQTMEKIESMCKDGGKICSLAKIRLKRKLEAVGEESKVGGSILILSEEYLTLFIIAILSIILHLQSKTLASNLSGANDGPGPAATVVAAGQALIGAGLAATQWAIGKTPPMNAGGGAGDGSPPPDMRMTGEMAPGETGAPGAAASPPAYSSGSGYSGGGGWPSPSWPSGGLNLSDETLKKLSQIIRGPGRPGNS